MMRTESDYAATLAGISHRYRGEQNDTLAGIDLMLKRGQAVALIGPSGAGKTTLLTLLDGRLHGWQGGAMVLQTALDPAAMPDRAWRADVGYIFQDFALVDRATVRRNVLNGRLGRAGRLASLWGHFSEEDHAVAETAMADAEIVALADKRVDQLSGGQRQRVAIARCLAQQPKLILADEPINNLDPVSAKAIMRLLSETAKRRDATLVFSSHQPDIAVQYADRVVALKDGSIAFDGDPDDLNDDLLARIYSDPEHRRRPSIRLVG